MTRTYEFQSDFARRHVSVGKAQAVLQVLEARRVTLSESDRNRIVECTDMHQLDEWLGRAATADSIDEVLA